MVNVDKITAFTKRDIEIGPKEMPIGETFKNSVTLLYMSPWDIVNSVNFARYLSQ